jgi:hypothetical protein
MRDRAAAKAATCHWELNASVDERIHLDILHAARDMESLRKLVELAKRDWRDLIMAAEYEMRDGKPVQTEWSKAMARERERR